MEVADCGRPALTPAGDAGWLLLKPNGLEGAVAEVGVPKENAPPGAPNVDGLAGVDELFTAGCPNVPPLAGAPNGKPDEPPVGVVDGWPKDVDAKGLGDRGDCVLSGAFCCPNPPKLVDEDDPNPPNMGAGFTSCFTSCLTPKGPETSAPNENDDDVLAPGWPNGEVLRVALGAPNANPLDGFGASCFPFA